MFQLTLDGKPYTPPTFGTEELVVRKPKLDIQCLVDKKARIEPNVMYAYLNYIMEELPEHAFRVLDNFDTSPVYLYEEITTEFKSSAVKVFYIAYWQMKRWRLILIKKDTMFQHYDPADPSAKGEGVLSDFAQQLMVCFQKGQNLSRKPNPPWPHTKERAESGTFVMIAISIHRNFSEKRWNAKEVFADEFRGEVVLKQLADDHEVRVVIRK